MIIINLEKCEAHKKIKETPIMIKPRQFHLPSIVGVWTSRNSTSRKCSKVQLGPENYSIASNFFICIQLWHSKHFVALS